MVLKLALALLICAAPGGDESAPWYERFKLGMEVGPTGAQSGSDPSDVGYAARFNGRDIVRKVVEAGGQYVVIWARDGSYAYYDSKVVAKCPGLGSRDVLRETVDEARKHDLPVIAYCVVQQDGPVLKEHPEYAMRDQQGNAIPGRLCLNSGYLEVVKALLAEQLAYGLPASTSTCWTRGLARLTGAGARIARRSSRPCTRDPCRRESRGTKAGTACSPSAGNRASSLRRRFASM